MFRLLLAAAAIALMAASPAVAGDAGSTTVSETPWTGFYIGANANWNWLSTDVSSSAQSYNGYDFASQNYGSMSGNGIGGGIQFGFDYQIQDIVLGIQAITSVTSVDSSRSAGNNKLDTNLNSFGSLNARIGYLLQPDILAYAKGGLAFGSFKYSDKNSAAGYSGSANDERHEGWMAGGGVEWMFAPHWSAFAEYDYTGIQDETVELSYKKAFWGNSFQYDYSQNIGSAVVGVNYRF